MEAFWIIFLLGIAAFIGTIIIAGNKNRNVFLWLLLAFLITPFLSFLIVLGMDKKMSYDEQKAIMEKQLSKQLKVPLEEIKILSGVRSC